jgi:hypothetical protein
MDILCGFKIVCCVLLEEVGAIEVDELVLMEA